MDGISGIITVFSIVAAFYGALLTVFMLILSALWLRMGNVQQELGGVQEGVNLLREHMQRNNKQLREDMKRSNDQLREDIHISQREFREEMLRSNNQLREDIHISQREFREEMLRSNNQLREDIHISQREFREDMQRSQDELREDFQRGHNQLMRAILAHSHRDDGRPTFDLPPDFEPTPADD